jgi:hypothetical protein
MHGIVASLLLAQAGPSPVPVATQCPTVEVRRLPEAGVPDSEYHGPPIKAGLDIVQVIVNPDGSIKSAKVYKSTSVESYDHATLADARRGVYLPKQVDCKNVEGMYMFEELFHGPP